MAPANGSERRPDRRGGPAIVTEKDWLRHSVQIFRFMIPGEVELFDLTQRQAAIDWAAA